ncbi:ferredoxin reductase family protein [Ottowia sp.]|uniref:ferredoxin reductase family protein n=1 Tax=Ottowia sp. TaxID=1898956 RepID=UPI002D10FF18|nr:ferredoxin reductase family protein [Ottowia sp.]HOB66214.1 ferredoxin reductase family protein [Ottowia sp.]HPZ56698.1 ferredoxin reductase family protein [Ottowia sp.]HQD47251.1 ferredoxin reductase family protein [Ottowia sp.]
MSWTGPILATLAVLATAALGLQTYAPYGTTTAVGVALGAGSITAMSLALMLSARPPRVERLFGGLDRMYGVHKWLGIAALALMIGHNTIEPDLEGFVRETRVGEFAADVGEIALNGFIGLLLISWIKRIPFTRLELPWPIWRFTHRFTGLLFAVAAFHQLAIDKPADVDGTLSLVLNALCLAGLAAWLFTQFVAPFLRPRHFVLERIERHGAVTELTLRPQGRAMHWQAGQFAFVSAPGAGMGEPHPFTIASAPAADGSLRLGIKALGDWTRRLPARLAPGQRVKMDGPYGRFVFRPRVPRQVWLAGGIGITPFLAWAEALTDADQQQIALVWAVTTRAEAFAAERLAGIAARHPNLTLHVVASAEDGRLTAERLAGLVPFALRDAALFYCGPSGLRDAIVSGLKAMGQRPRRVHSEAFELR